MTKVRVLVIDDAAFMRDIVKKGMRSAYPAFQLDEAAHGKQAQTMIGKSDYDLILCDWEMPVMNGAELLRWIRETPEHAHLPFIMITSRGDKENVVEAIKLKVSNYIVKPFTNEKLINIATDVMSKAMKLSAKQLQEIGGARPDKIQSGSVAILTGGRRTGGGKRLQCQTESVKPKGKVVVQLRFSGETLGCLIKEVSQHHIQGVIKRSEHIPGILDLAVIDIEAAGDVSRLNGFIHTLQAREDSRETEFVNIDIRLVDQDDPEKMDHLQRFMNSIA